MRRSILIGGVCFFLGTISLVFAQTAMRPDQFIASVWTWTGIQTFTVARVTLSTPAISTSTFTLNMNAGQDFKVVLVNAACPCTIANPSNMPSTPQHGVIEIKQSATGSDTIGTWGSQWITAGGVTALTLSSSANASDFFSYDVIDSTHILIVPAAANATH